VAVGPAFSRKLINTVTSATLLAPAAGNPSDRSPFGRDLWHSFNLSSHGLPERAGRPWRPPVGAQSWFYAVLPPGMPMSWRSGKPGRWPGLI